jgi:hypothetical protein
MRWPSMREQYQPARSLRISNALILIGPVDARFSLRGNRIDYLEAPMRTGNSGRFSIIGGE